MARRYFTGSRKGAKVTHEYERLAAGSSSSALVSIHTLHTYCLLLGRGLGPMLAGIGGAGNMGGRPLVRAAGKEAAL